MISNDKRRYDFDAMRATMMLLGIVFHACVSFMVVDVGALWPHRAPYSNLFFDAIVGTIHAFRIPLFFMISGFFLSRQLSRHPMNKVLKKRIRRVLIPFIVCFILIAPILKYAFYALILDAQPEVNIPLFSKDAFALYIYNWSWNTVHFWFLYYLIIFHVIQFLLEKIPNLTVRFSNIPLWKSYVTILIIQVTTVMVFGIESTDGHYSLVPSIGSLIYYFSFYFLGNQTYHHLPTFDSWIDKAKGIYIIAFIFCTIFLLIRLQSYNAENSSILEGLEALFAILATNSLIIGAYRFFKTFFSENTWIVSYFSRASYLIYIVHLPILVWALKILQPLIQNPFILSFLLIFITGCLSVLLFEIQQKYWKKLL